MPKTRPPVVTAPIRTAPPPPPTGMGQVYGQTARGLTTLFGKPILDVREASGRKLQFANATCVLDAYLYAQKSGQEPVVTYVDTRQRSGSDIDRASCVAALIRR